MITVAEHDVVRLKDGREGTVVHAFSRPRTAYLIETSDDMEKWPTVESQEIEAVIWKS